MPFSFPFLDEEERRRRMLTPGINPNAPAPNIPMPTRSVSMPPSENIPIPTRPNIPLATPPINPREAPIPESRPAPMTRMDELGGAKAEFMAKAPGRLKSGLLNALRGAAQGLATGGGLGAAAGGALAGGAFGAINPRGAREMEFEQVRKPQILERFGMEDQEQARRMAAEKALRDEQMMRADIDLKQSQAQKNRMPALPRPVGPQWRDVMGEDGQPTVVDMNAPENRGKLFRPYEKPVAPKQLTSAELQTDPEDGMSVEEKAEASYQGRGGDRYVLSKLPSPIRQILEKGTVMVPEVDKAGKQTGRTVEDAASLEDLEAAQRTLDAAIKRQRDTDMQYTRGHIRARRLGVGRKPKPSGAQSGISRPRSDFHSDKFPGANFDP